MGTDQKHTHSLSHLIEPPEVAQSYVPRKVGGTPVHDADGNLVQVSGGKRDLNVLHYCYQRSQRDKRLFAPRLVGPTGSGKSLVARAFSSITQLPLVTVSGSDGFDSLTAFGRYIPDPTDTKKIVWQDSDLLTAIKEGGIIVLDEINFFTGAQTALFHPLLDSRRGVTVFDLGGLWVPAHKDLLVIATYNDGGGYEGTRRLNAAFANRFQLSLEWGYDQSVELTLTGSPTLVGLANEIRTLEAQGVIQTPVPTNALVEFVELAYDINPLFAAESFLQRFPAQERASIRERIVVEDLLTRIGAEATHKLEEGCASEEAGV